MSSARKARVEHALKEALQAAITNDVKDPRVRAATRSNRSPAVCAAS